MFRVKVYITFKEGVADPQGATILHALHSLGWKKVNKVKTGKYFQIELEEEKEGEVKKAVEKMCERILVNPVIEKYEYQIEKVR
ncbi:phosphoribosylformylglycinamidine synthase subunit PurS [Candidatus Aerophobetes bacterium]|nr:phosphoribosylformylglycinamidine synthase subunit PurS [Candidatus Aerophobetes bacterium]